MTCTGSPTERIARDTVFAPVVDSTHNTLAAASEPRGTPEPAACFGVSLVVATVNRRAELETLFASLLGQTFRSFEVILIDQNEGDLLDASVANAISHGLDVRRLRLSPPDQSVARNAGLREARYPLVAFPDDDCWYECDVLDRVCSTMRNPKLHLTIGCWVERGDESCAAGKVVAQDLLRFRNVIGASMITVFLRTELARRIGGFDPRFGLGKFFGGGEDTDLLFRAISAADCGYFLPDVRIHHPMKRTGGDPDLSDIRGRARGLGALYIKHRLEWWVVLRGLIGPLYRSLISLRAPGEPGCGIVTSLGRLEGVLAWTFRGCFRAARDGGK